MLVTLQGDGVLRIYPSTEDAVGDVEALDVEETFRMVFDETGRRYAIRWVRALVADGTVDVGELLRLIRESTLVEPESVRPWLADLTSRLTPLQRAGFAGR